METTTARKSNKDLPGWEVGSIDYGVTYIVSCDGKESERTYRANRAFERARAASKRHTFAFVWMRDLSKHGEDREVIVAKFMNGKRTQ